MLDGECAYYLLNNKFDRICSPAAVDKCKFPGICMEKTENLLKTGAKILGD
jgi:hypothetical protein